jgi:hypothetical protein
MAEDERRRKRHGACAHHARQARDEGSPIAEDVPEQAAKR